MEMPRQIPCFLIPIGHLTHAGAHELQFSNFYRVDINFVIKVADFGLSENVDPSRDYFRQNSKDEVKLPVKWLAPESLNDGKFSEKTDVVML